MTDSTGGQSPTLLQMLREGVTAADRALADEALSRALVLFMRNKGEDDHGPYSRDDLERVCGPHSAVMLLIAEAELAIAAARVLERARCARIAEEFGNPGELLGRNVEATCKAIALQIRTPK
jgi:hypothetical protein